MISLWLMVDFIVVDGGLLVVDGGLLVVDGGLPRPEIGLHSC